MNFNYSMLIMQSWASDECKYDVLKSFILKKQIKLKNN